MIALKESVTGAVQILVDTLTCVEPEGMTTGFAQLDGLMRGMRRGSLTVLASLPGLGKTGFALNVANNLIGRSPATPVLYCSALSHTELAFRLLSIVSGEDCSYDGDLGAEGIAKLTETVRTISDCPLCFGDSRPMDRAFLRTVAKLQRKNRFGLLIVDPVRPEHLADLKKLAQDLDVPILALLTVRRRNAPIPELAAADTVIRLYRHRIAVKSVSGTAIMDFIVSRNRFGMCGTCRMYFTPRTMQFKEEENAEGAEGGFDRQM